MIWDFIAFSDQVRGVCLYLPGICECSQDLFEETWNFRCKEINFYIEYAKTF